MPSKQLCIESARHIVTTSTAPDAQLGIDVEQQLVLWSRKVFGLLAGANFTTD
jgi:hypothetical protein